MKTKLRNILNTGTINVALHKKQHIKGGKNCINFQPNDEMLSRMTKNILYEKSDGNQRYHRKYI